MLDTAYYPTCVHPPGLLSTTPLQYVNIYIDDFLGLAQQPYLKPTLHHIVQGIFQIFRDEPHPDDPPDRRHIISETKLAKGYAAWSTQKIILGWLLDTAKGTLSLPSHKATRLRQILAGAQHKTRTSRRQWQKLLGELRHMASALWGAKYLFSTLQHVLSDTAAPRLRLSPLVKATLHDWSLLATSLETHPVPIASLVPQAPSYLGAVDASSAGCGGFWVATKYGRVAPFAFHWKFPTAIQHQLLSLQNPLGTLTNSNPSGTVSNSDLELAAIILGTTLVAQCRSTAHANTALAMYNTSALSWIKEGSATSSSTNAYLLHLLAQFGCATLYNITPVFTSGSSNVIADCFPRLFYMSDVEFCSYMNSNFPVQPSCTHPT